MKGRMSSSSSSAPRHTQILLEGTIELFQKKILKRDQWCRVECKIHHESLIFKEVTKSFSSSASGKLFKRHSKESGKIWDVIYFKNVSGVQYVDKKSGEFTLELRDRTLVRFRCKDSAQRWVQAIERATALSSAVSSQSADTGREDRYHFTMLQEDLKYAKNSFVWCSTLEKFMTSDYARLVDLIPVTSSAEFDRGHFVEDVKGTVPYVYKSETE